ncbi:hypothetical protein TNCV_3290721 [Trichonephila clavipes]|nr:hypothetical protein TNCV_3290721 [Trichonephila clavipes]
MRFTSTQHVFSGTKTQIPDLPDSVVSDTDCCVVSPLGSNSGEDMDVCKCIVPSRHGGAINSSQAANPLAKLVEGKER